MGHAGGQGVTPAPDDAEEPAPAYALRILPRAERDIRAALLRLAELSGDAVAQAWYENLYTELAALSINPARFARTREDRLFRREVRQLVYRRTPSGVAYRVLFTVVAGGQDAPTVAILHVRHGARRDVTRAEARSIEADDPAP